MTVVGKTCSRMTEVWMDLRFSRNKVRELQRSCANWHAINERSVAFTPSLLLVFHVEKAVNRRTDVQPELNMVAKFNMKDKLKLWMNFIAAETLACVNGMRKRWGDCQRDITSDANNIPWFAIPFRCRTQPIWVKTNSSADRIGAVCECGFLCSMWIVNTAYATHQLLGKKQCRHKLYIEKHTAETCRRRVEVMILLH